MKRMIFCTCFEEVSIFSPPTLDWLDPENDENFDNHDSLFTSRNF
jgi:hypothetical protein